MRFVAALTDVDTAGAKVDQRSHSLLLIIDRRGCQIEMVAILARLLFPDLFEDDPESGAIRWCQADLVIGVVVVVVVG
jgi:hypothetical protein